jgi:uncharacterized protein YbjT (DUF2867 family)
VSELVVVTGAAGKTGRAVTAALSRRGVPVRALVHRREQAAAGVPGAAETVVADLTDPVAVTGALLGASAAYLIAPNMFDAEFRMIDILVRGCHAAGVQRVVYHSVIHPFLPAMPHHVDKAKVEAMVHGCGLNWVILQPASYFENAYGVWDSVRGAGTWPLPYAAEAPFTPVALDDVAEVAAATLTDPRHRFATYELAGPEVLTTAEMADIAGEALGRGVSVVVDRDPAAAAARPPRLQAMFDYYHRHGICGNGTVLAALLRRPPVTWHGWVLAHR